ncbi:MAG TPA: acetyltransferase [Bryobacteraceae bacterium]|nr:acetyltransferase [Bryobacteraceae bacterium]
MADITSEIMSLRVSWFCSLGMPALLCVSAIGSAQVMLRPSEAGELIHPMPSDVVVLESDEPRKDIPCTVTPRKPELGFDLRFHSGYEVTVPLKELAGEGGMLSIIFRVAPEADREHATYFVQHYRVPPIEEDAKGDALLEGSVDVGEGTYHIDWLMRDQGEHLCSTTWTTEAALPAKDKPMPLFISPNQITQTAPEPFVNDSVTRANTPAEEALKVKLLVNFAPQGANSPALQRSDTEALVSILKAIGRDPHVARIELVAFNIQEGRIVYRQNTSDTIDFPALGKALDTVKLGTVDIAKLGQKHSETDFLESLITQEMGTTSHPDAVIFAGPKTMLDADVPQEDLRRIGDIECPVFYMNYNLNPQAVPWKDAISHAIKPFKGVEYTISRPRDLWVSTSEMFNRILRSKHQHVSTGVASGGLQ